MAGIYRWIYEDIFGGNEFLLGTLGTYIVAVVTYWTPALLFLYVDLTGRPRWLAKHKVQEDSPQLTDMKKLKKAVKVVAFNNLVITGLSSFSMYHSMTRAGCGFHPDQIPTIPRILLDFTVFTIVQEIIFYYSHRLFHIPFLYKYVHKRHHEWTAPIGLIAIYTSPIEYLTGNGLSVFLGPLLMSSHISVSWLWFSVAHLFTVIHHSGYHVPLLPSPQFHDFHHLRFNYNYGTLGILDRLHGTDSSFQKSVQKKRHRVLLGMRPMTKIFPTSTDNNIKNR